MAEAASKQLQCMQVCGCNRWIDTRVVLPSLATPGGDVTVVAFSPAGRRAAIPFHDRALAPFRHLTAVASSFLPGRH